MGFPGECVGSANVVPVWGWVVMEGVCEKDVFNSFAASSS